MSEQDDQWLAPPGAGIPWIERTALGGGIRVAAQFMKKDRLTDLFRREALESVRLARTVSEERGRTRVLVSRLPGIEDSSRNWSVYMTIEHLVIVNSTVAAMLPRLYAGRDISTEIRVEEVKPLPEAGPEQMDDLMALVERYTDIVDKLGNLRAGSTHAHPWFGPLNAAQWHALATVHNSTHRRHIERILRQL